MALRKSDDERTTELVAPDRDQFNMVTIEDGTTIASFEDAFSQFAEAGIVVERADQVMVDAFPEIDKKKLVNIEILLLTWQRSRPESEDYGSPYVVVRGITRDGRRFRFTDGSTGVASQLINLTKKRIEQGHAAPNAGLHVPHGLTRSTYKTTVVVDGQTKTIDAETFYLSGE